MCLEARGRAGRRGGAQGSYLPQLLGPGGVSRPLERTTPTSKEWCAEKLLTSSPQPRFPTWDTPFTPSSAHLTCLPFRAFEVESPGSWKDPQLRPLGRPPHPVQSCTELQAPPHFTLPWSSSLLDPRPTEGAPSAHALCANLTSVVSPQPVLALTCSLLPWPPLSAAHSPIVPIIYNRIVFDYVEPDQGHRALAGP